MQVSKYRNYWQLQYKQDIQDIQVHRHLQYILLC